MNILLLSDTDSREIVYGFARKGQTILTGRLDSANTSLEPGKADLILLDCGTNVTLGLKRLRVLKLRWPGVPIIFITAKSSEDVILKVFRLGGKDFFKKPINVFELKKTVTNLLQLKKTSGEHRKPLLSKAGEVAAPYAQATTAIPDSILRSLGYIEDNLVEDITLEKLAKKSGMSKYHFCRVFKKHLGMSPMRFITFMRIERAKTLLMCGNHSVSAIAEEMGFNDLSNFIKCFKSISGVTPTAFRKTIKNKREVCDEVSL